MRDQRIKDVLLEKQFYEDWNKLPQAIQNTLDRKIDLILKHRSIVNSFQAHKVDDLVEPVWIGYVNYGNGGYRVLFEFTSNGMLVFKRVLSHDQMETVLKELSKSY